MGKRIIGLLAALLAVAAFAREQDGFVIDDESNYITAYTGKAKALVIDAAALGAKGIAEQAFEQSKITSLVVGEGIEEIDDFVN